MAQFYNDKIEKDLQKSDEEQFEKDILLNYLLIDSFLRYANDNEIISIKDFNDKFSTIYKISDANLETIKKTLVNQAKINAEDFTSGSFQLTTKNLQEFINQYDEKVFFLKNQAWNKLNSMFEQLNKVGIEDDLYNEFVQDIIKNNVIVGENFVLSSDGKKWKLQHWFNRWIRTAIAEDLIDNTLDLADEFNEDLVIINYLTDSSQLCLNYQNRIYSISGNNKRYSKLDPALWRNGGGLFHPNCRHFMSVYIKGLTDKPIPKDDINKKDIKRKREARNKGNYYNRQYEEWRERYLSSKRAGNDEYARVCRQKYLNYRKLADEQYAIAES